MTVRTKLVTSLLAGLLATGVGACDDTTEGNGDEMDDGGTGNSEMTEDMNDEMEDDGTSGDDMNDEDMNDGEMNGEDEMEEDGG
ncbi:hypothetical protein SAMN06265360_11758 [Haloechinothrix alba]|uniref:DNA primase n=1 Tax=Haloechinothrix alba TaxID=664784 RepID=A0A238YVU4_9PSEU|nr:hypothetical protein [Haloechinothrix alba]SNR74851.1 hypothetical protein SAMN06265360_11758 [Haloechinothrix alba]